MCTVTFIAQKNGYALGMNRDEKLARVQAHPPARHELDGMAALFPSEPGGGTWMGVNDKGVALALINWYSVAARAKENVVSRGAVVRRALAGDSPESVEAELAGFPLHCTNPFRLIGVFPRSKLVLEWRWNLSRLATEHHEWKTNIWISSGFDEPGAQQMRRATFERVLERGGLTEVNGLRRFHASHAPLLGPYSVCMHRQDAATVSYTEAQVNQTTASISYASGALCSERLLSAVEMKLREPASPGTASVEGSCFETPDTSHRLPALPC